MLRSIGGLFAASDAVERDDFHRFAQGALSHHRDIQALEWIPRVTDAERAAYEEAGRRDGLAGFQFSGLNVQGQPVRAAQRVEYFPVFYVEPLVGNEAAAGFDLASDPTQFGALEKARDSGTVVATAAITPVQQADEQPGFLTFLPIYGNGAPQATLEERRENLDGFALGVFRIADLVEASLTGLPSGVVMLLYDRKSPVGERPLHVYAQPPQKGMASQIGEELAQTRAELQWGAPLDVHGWPWSAVFLPTPEFLSTHGIRQAWGVLAAGLLLTAVTGAYMLNRILHTARVEGLAADLSKTIGELEGEIANRSRAEEALRESESRIRLIAENLREVFWLFDPIANQTLYVSPAYEEMWGRARKSVYDEPHSWTEAVHPEDRTRVNDAP